MIPTTLQRVPSDQVSTNSQCTATKIPQPLDSFENIHDQDLQFMPCYVSKSLEESSLSNNPQSPGSVEWFQQTLSRLPKEKLVKFLETAHSKDLLKVIRILDLTNKQLTANDLNQILSILAKIGPNDIEEFNLEGNCIGNQGANAIANFKNLTKLSKLNLEHNCIDDDGANDIANSTSLTKLTELNLKYNNISNRVICAIIHSERLANLAQLTYSFTETVKRINKLEDIADIANSTDTLNAHKSERNTIISIFNITSPRKTKPA